MNIIRLPVRGRSVRGATAFTMVELMLCIGIVAFAMVAIMGVMPSGLTVQRQNKEDTIIDQEGPLWMNILRGGQTGFDDLTNYVDFVLVEHTSINFTVGPNPSGSGGQNVFGFRGPFFTDAVPNPNLVLDVSSNLVSLLTIPKFEADQGVVYSNKVTAVFRSFSGAFNTMIRPGSGPGFRPEDTQLSDAFRYQMQVELTPVTTGPTLDLGVDRRGSFTNEVTRKNISVGGFLNALRLEPDRVSDILKDPAYMRPDRDPLSATMYDLRITLRWPVNKIGENYVVGAGLRSFRTRIVGRPMFSFYDPSRGKDSVYWPNTPLRPRRIDPWVVNRDLTR